MTLREVYRIMDVVVQLVAQSCWIVGNLLRHNVDSQNH